jgi:hypothetical protein
MKQGIRGQSIEALIRKYPIQGLVPGWYFRKDEVSNGHWIVEGTDRWGRLVSASGEDSESLLLQCVDSAKELERQINKSA